MKTIALNRFAYSLALVIAFGFVSPLNQEGFAASKPKKDCAKKIATKTDTAAAHKALSDKIATYVKTHKSVPKQRELTKALNIATKELRAFMDEIKAKDMRELVAKVKELSAEPFTTLRKKLISKAAKFIKENLRLPSRGELILLADTTKRDLTLLYGEVDESFYAEMQVEEPATINTLRNKLIKGYARIARQTGRVPVHYELASLLEISESELNDLNNTLELFESFVALKEAAKEAQPGSFKLFTDTDEFNEDRLEDLKRAIRDRSRLIVTSANAGSSVHENAFRTLLKVAEKRDAEIIIQPVNMQTVGLDKRLKDTPGVHILTHEMLFTTDVTLSRLKVTANQINPTMGTRRLGKRGKLMVVGSPKMHIDPAATVANKISPHRVVTAGSITVKDDYNAGHYQGQRTAYLASKDHVIGALMLEKSYGKEFTDFETTGFFHERHIEYSELAQGWTDIGYRYTESKVTKVRPEALVLGDIHVGDTDQRLLESIKTQLLALRPKVVVLHDLLNGYSVSPHDKDNIIELSRKAKDGKLILTDEIARVVNFVDALMNVDPEIKVVVVPSNHDYWLHRWLRAGTFVKEPQNTRIGAELLLELDAGVDPFKAALLHKDYGVQYPKRLVFLDIGKPYAAGYTDPEDPENNQLVELSLHGHQGKNGARLSIKAMEEAVDRGIFGHTHTYARRNSVVNVGTITHLDLGYNRGGFSSWVQSAAVVWPFGQIQAFRYTEGEWFANPEAEAPDPDRFFPPNYPRELPNPGPAHEGHIDQWSKKKPKTVAN